MHEVQHLTSLSKSDFLKNHRNHPFVISGMTDNWPAMMKWSSDYFSKKNGHIKVYVKKKHPAVSDFRLISLADYMDYMAQCDEDSPYYLVDWVWQGDIPEMKEDFFTPDHFKSWMLKDVFSWMYIGPKKSGSPLHQDIASTGAWNAVISGKKRWAFYPPDQTKYLYGGKVDVFNPDLEKYPLFALACEPLICIQYPGDIVYTPSNWWHQVVNDEICISITENFVNQSNFKAVKWSKLFGVLALNRIFRQRGVQMLRKWSLKPKEWTAI